MRFYYRTCQNCGAHLDPGERCDCLDDLHEADDEPETQQEDEEPAKEAG